MALGFALLSSAAHAAAQPPPVDAAAVSAPGDAVLARLHASGSQVYACAAGVDGAPAAWSFREPQAVLTDEAGRAVGRHARGPVWRLDDGSAVTGRVVLTRPGATPPDAPLLRLEVVSHEGSGMIAGARTVLRVRTRGGALSGPCTAPGEVRDVPYTADYVFLR